MLRSKIKEKDPHFEPDLAKLGFKLQDGKFVSVHDGSFFNFFFSEEERTNQVRKGAMQEAVRKEVARRLRETYGIVESYVGGGGGRNVSPWKPSGPHVTIYSTPVSQLRKKSHVFIFCGESGTSSGGAADGGIFAWRALMGEGGTDKGCALGLAARLHSYGKSLEKDGDEDAEGTSTTKLPSISEEDPMPGLIILNPGQLIYSYSENECLTQAAWDARQRPDGNLQGYEIDEVYNRVEGHENADKHIRTMLDHILPQLVREDVKINIIAIGDSAGHVVDILDQNLFNDMETGIAKQLECLAFVGPQIDNELVCDGFKLHMRSYGRSWIESDEPLGSLVSVPAPDPNLGIKPTVEDIPGIWTGPGEYKPHDRKASIESGAKFFDLDPTGDIIDKTDEANEDAPKDESAAPANYDTIPADNAVVLGPLGGKAASAAEAAATDDDGPADITVEAKLPGMEITSAEEDAPSDDAAATDNDGPAEIAVEVGLSKMKITSAEDDASADEVTPAEDDTSVNEDAPINTPDPSDRGSVSPVPSDDEYEDSPPLPLVLCPTFSAGDCGGNLEMVFPKLMDKILDFIFSERERVVTMKAQADQADMEREQRERREKRDGDGWFD